MGRTISLTGIITALLFSFSVQAQNSSAIRLNSLENSRAKILSSGNGASAWDFEMNSSLNTDEIKVGQIIEVQLPDGMRSLKVIRRSEYMPGTVSFAAVEEDDQEKIFSFTFGSGVIVGLYHHQPDESLMFAYDADRSQPVIIKGSYFEALGCELEHDHIDPSLPAEERIRQKGSSTESFRSPVTAMSMIESLDDSITIDLMIPYTAAARRAASRNIGLFSIDNVIAQAMNLSQTALDNSRTAIKLRLVHTYETDYDETTDGVSSGDRLRRLTSSPTYTPPFLADHAGYMNEVHPLRDEYGADLVALFADVSDTGGIAWVLGSPYGFDPLGFSLNRVLQVASGYTLIHEIGHNMGNLHSRTQQSQAAGPRGGLFHYSVGFQNRIDSVHTVMAYAEGLDQVPVFSSPDFQWNGSRIGSSSTFIPTDNSRSMREIKRVISTYRTTTTDAPDLTTSTDQITVQLMPGSTFSVPFEIGNEGLSDLMWGIDFELSDNPVIQPGRAKSSSAEIEQTVDIHRMEGVRSTQSEGLVQLDNELFFETSFEAIQNYQTGRAVAANSWEVITSDNTDLQVENENASDGSQHLRIENDNSGNPIYISSPFLGPLPLAKYQVDFSFSFSAADTVTESFEFYLNDRRRSEYSAGIRISNNGNEILALGAGELGDGVFFSTGTTLTPDTYHNARIILNSDSQQLEYYINGSLIATHEYAGGRTPEELFFGTLNTSAGATLDVDNVSMTLLDYPFSYLNVDRVSGVVTPGSSEVINLDVDAAGMELGTYNTVMTLFTNNGADDEIQIPLQIEVTNQVSNEEFTDVPDELSLEQNYPNPFNPATEIRYTVREPQNITIDVYSIHGQKVATLYEGYQNSGEFSVSFDASGLASGVYLYRLTGNAASVTKRMVLIK